MSLFERIFRRSLSEEETERCLDEIERLAKLPYFLPATERIAMLGSKAPARILGPGGPLHDRFVTCMNRLVQRAARGGSDQVVRITPAWEALPNVLMTTADFGGDAVGMHGRQLLDAIRSKEFVVLANVNPNVRERDPSRQMRLYFELIDNPRWAMVLLIFAGSLIVRSSVLRKHPDCVTPARFGEMFPRLGAAAGQEGKVKVFR
jgi:hypothetical protein